MSYYYQPGPYACYQPSLNCGYSYPAAPTQPYGEGGSRGGGRSSGGRHNGQPSPFAPAHGVEPEEYGWAYTGCNVGAKVGAGMSPCRSLPPTLLLPVTLPGACA